MSRHLFNTDKIRYVKGEKPGLPCILCAIRDRDQRVESLEIARLEGFIVSVNLFPFNTGHLLVFPERHINSVAEYSDTEALDLHRITKSLVGIIQNEFSPSGFNIGYNMGDYSGASIEHLHLHIVPRYRNESGFLDVISGTKVVVTDPVRVMEKIRERMLDVQDNPSD